MRALANPRLCGEGHATHTTSHVEANMSRFALSCTVLGFGLLFAGCDKGESKRSSEAQEAAKQANDAAKKAAGDAADAAKQAADAAAKQAQDAAKQADEAGKQAA